MIQRERDRRLREQAEMVAKQADKARRKTEQARVLSLENRQFLENLGIPSSLEDIIAEENLDGAYVLWSNHGCFISVEQDRSGGDLQSGDKVKVGSNISEKSRFATGVSLVWNIRYAPGYPSSDWGGAGSGYSGSDPGRSAGYEFKFIEVIGCAEKQFLIVSDRYYSYILLEDKLDSVQFIRQRLAVAYLTGPLNSYSQTWPFDRWVPEAEAVRKKIIE